MNLEKSNESQLPAIQKQLPTATEYYVIKKNNVYCTAALLVILALAFIYASPTNTITAPVVTSGHNIQQQSPLVSDLEKVTLEAVGMSDSELTNLQTAGAKTNAVYWLKELNGEEGRDYMADFVRDYLAEGKLTFEDIGTNEHDFNLMIKSAKLKTAKYWTDEFRKNPGELYMADFAKKYLAEANIIK